MDFHTLYNQRVDFPIVCSTKSFIDRIDDSKNKGLVAPFRVVFLY